MEGSNLSGVTSRCSWEQLTDYDVTEADENKENEVDRHLMTQSGTRWCRVDVSSLFQWSCRLWTNPSNFEKRSQVVTACVAAHSARCWPAFDITPWSQVWTSLIVEWKQNLLEESFRRNNASRKESIDSCLRPETPSDILRTRSVDGVHLKLNLEAGSLLPLAVK
jgi:hypothetical protein